MPQFTKDQLLCIETETKDMLVAAGAGSGKTTVLAERIMRRLESGADIKDFLVVTFTNTAAADLKLKLAERLERLCVSAPDNRAYRRMLYSIDSADICTIDSFCLQYVKQNAAYLGLTGGCSVGDEALCAALLTDAADSVLTSLCENDEQTAEALLDNFASHKSDDGLINAILSLYGKLRAYPFYLWWFEKVLQNRKKQAEVLKEKGFFACTAGLHIKEAITTQLSAAYDCLNTMQACAENEKQGAFADKVWAIADAIQQGLANGYAAFCTACSLPRLTRPTGCSDGYVKAYDKFKAIIKGLSVYVRTESALSEEFALEQEVLEALYKYTCLLDAEYTAAKRERGVLDFADAEHLMLKLLVLNSDKGYIKTPFCKQLSAAYTDVFIDEYQDVSPLQNDIFRAMGEGKRFMVGDVKQSIYGFRNAYPDIFTAYRDSFLPAEDGGTTARITLKENFRCDKPIVEFCNLIFDKVFTKETAGTDYKEERLIYGKTSDGNTPVKLLLLENGDTETEAALLAEEAVRLIKSGTKPKDIAFLTRKVDNIATVAAALKERGVPCHATKTRLPLLSRPSVLLALSLLRVIDNPTDDISLAALLRSPLFGFTADDLLAIRRGGSMYEDVCAAVTNSTRFINKRFRLKGSTGLTKPQAKPLLIKKTLSALSEKCIHFTEKLSLYRKRALFMPVNDLLWYLYEDTHLLLFAPEGKEKQQKDELFALLSLAQSFENGIYKGVHSFVEYINRLEDTKRSPDAPTAKAEGAVSLMTVHGSKGLEFPVVFVCGMGGKLLKADRAEAVSANYNSGISVKLAKQEAAWKSSTLLRDSALKDEDARVIAEEYRVLYVAFTRAREKLYISAATASSAEKYLSRSVIEPSHYADLFIRAAAETKNECFCFETVNGEGLCVPVSILADEETAQGDDISLPPLDVESESPQRAIAKHSVSELVLNRNGTLGVKPLSQLADRRPAFASEAIGVAAKKGTANHAFLQFASFTLAEKDIEAEAKRLLDKGFLDKEQYGLLDMGALAAFFASPLYQEIKASPCVYREKRFTTKISSALFGVSGTETVLIQGVIDCFYENADGTFTLVDYKTDALRSGEEALLIDKHRTQLMLYADYIAKLTGKAVSSALIYSLTLNKSINVDIKPL